MPPPRQARQLLIPQVRRLLYQQPFHREFQLLRQHSRQQSQLMHTGRHLMHLWLRLLR